jgi:Holliday junction resolvasome RuvABC endonuclease subunit
MPTGLCFDPSLTKWGWVVFQDGIEFIDAGCIRTTADSSNGKIEDKVRRVRHIYRTIRDDIISEYDPDWVGSEWLWGGQRYNAIWTSGMMGTMVPILFEDKELPVEYVAASKINKPLTGKKSATKEDVQFSVLQEYPSIYEHIPDVKYKREAICDAVAVLHFCRMERNSFKVLF